MLWEDQCRYLSFSASKEAMRVCLYCRVLLVTCVGCAVSTISTLCNKCLLTGALTVKCMTANVRKTVGNDAAHNDAALKDVAGSQHMAEEELLA